MQRNILVLLVTLAVAVTAGFGAATVAAADHATVAVDQKPGEPATVTVTDANNESVANASVSVVVDNQSEYVGTGNYTTDVNGTVELPAPEETVDVTATATVDNETVSTTATLETLPELDLTVEQDAGSPATVTVTAEDEPIENATVDVEPVDENATYVGANETYTTDVNGTVELPAPEETVNVTVTATEGDRSTTVTTTLEALPELAVAVEQEPGESATVTVTAEDEPIENATVDVEPTDENATYVGANETYTTDVNGTVELPAPEETVEVVVTATEGDRSATVTTTLEAAPTVEIAVEQLAGQPATVTVTANGDAAANATVDIEAVDENATYAGVGAYTADQDGIVELPAPEETVDVTITATYQGGDASVVETLEALDTVDDDDSFGQRMAAFVAEVRNGTNGELDRPFGHIIAAFAVQNNPGNAPGHAGPPENVTQGPPENVTQGPPENVTQGPPENVTQGPPENVTQGPPEHAGPGNDDGENATDGSSDRGPPEHAGPGGDDGDDDRGPPAHAGPGDDTDSDDETDDTDSDDETDDTDSDDETDDTDSDDTDSEGDGESSDSADDGDERGPPDHAGPGDDGDSGPPEDAGPDDDDDRGPPEDAGPGDNGGGPPGNGGPP